jgi:hypothetical protein
MNLKINLIFNPHHRWKHAKCNHVEKKAKKKKQPKRILQAYENETSYTPEHGHVGRNMQ